MYAYQLNGWLEGSFIRLNYWEDHIYIFFSKSENRWKWFDLQTFNNAEYLFEIGMWEYYKGNEDNE